MEASRLHSPRTRCPHRRRRLSPNPSCLRSPKNSFSTRPTSTSSSSLSPPQPASYRRAGQLDHDLHFAPVQYHSRSGFGRGRSRTASSASNRAAQDEPHLADAHVRRFQGDSFTGRPEHDQSNAQWSRSLLNRSQTQAQHPRRRYHSAAITIDFKSHSLAHHPLIIVHDGHAFQSSHSQRV